MMAIASKKSLIIILGILFSLKAFSQEINGVKDSLNKDKPKPDQITLMTYARVISDANSNIRCDENLVGNFKLKNLFRLEAGIRFGERPQHFDSYYHYKLELQTKYFFKIARVIGRISDNVLNYPYPSYRKTNILFALETKYSLSKAFQVLAAGGYVITAQQNNKPDALPTTKGIQNNYLIFKLAVKYNISEKSHIELAYGSYDVFNPYALNSPFSQISGDIELSKVVTLYSYFRYQYKSNITTPNNYFFVLGIMFHLPKKS